MKICFCFTVSLLWHRQNHKDDTALVWRPGQPEYAGTRMSPTGSLSRPQKRRWASCLCSLGMTHFICYYTP